MVLIIIRETELRGLVYVIFCTTAEVHVGGEIKTDSQVFCLNTEVEGSVIYDSE